MDYRLSPEILAYASVSTGFKGSGGTCAVVANAGDGKMWGFEAELSAEPVYGLMIDASFSTIGSEYKTISNAVGGTITPGSPIVSPEIQGSFGIQYDIEMGSSGTIIPRFDTSYRGRAFASTVLNGVDPDFEYVAGYWLADARLSWRNDAGDLELALEVTNLFDEYYMPFRFDAVFDSTGTAYAQIGRPREWALGLKKIF